MTRAESKNKRGDKKYAPNTKQANRRGQHWTAFSSVLVMD